ncbi:MAG: glutamate--tRNA ligase [archaeon]
MKESILKYALQNAVKYGGKANPGTIIGKMLSLKPELKKKVPELAKEVNLTIKEVNKLSVERQLEKLKEIAPELLEEKKGKKGISIPDLPNAKPGKVVMRLAPYPSGPLHIGNVKIAMLNDALVKKYKGKLLLIMDDTIGSEEKSATKDAYKLIPDGLKWLGIKFDKKIIYKSDRLEIYYKYAEELIKKGQAYVCKCDSQTLRDNRASGKICECREAGMEKTLDEWKKMHTTYKDGEAALRIKTSMDHPNPAFRDRVLFRISDRKHVRVGNKYRVWPLLEFSWAVDDVLLGITHVLRGKELMIESEMEKFIWNIFGWKQPELLHSGLLTLEGVKLSKSKAKKEVESGEYTGWDDPRTWSIQALERRGLLPEAIRTFCLSFGMNQNEITVPIESLYAENRKLLDPEVNRYFFVENPKKIKIKESPIKKTEAPLHPTKQKGKRPFKVADEFYVTDKISKGKVYRFMHLFNFKDGKFVSEKYDPKLKAKMMHWLPAVGNINVEILMPDGSVKTGLGESNIKNIKVGEVIQFERFGFCKLDKKGTTYKFWYTHD